MSEGCAQAQASVRGAAQHFHPQTRSATSPCALLTRRFPLAPHPRARRLVRTIHPESVPKFNQGASLNVHKKMENVSLFLKAARAMGLQEFELFSTADLTEEKNMKGVINCVHALGRLMQSPAFEHLPLPKLGVKAAQRNVRGWWKRTRRRCVACASLPPR